MCTVEGKKHRKAILSFLVVLLFSALPVLAQLAVSTLLGTVKDSSGGVIAGAKVTIINVDTNETRTATTGEDGAFRFEAVPTGHYTAKFEKDGFQTENETGLTLEVATPLVINAGLQVGSSTQEVTVTGEAPLVNTTTSALGGLVTEEKMADLPLNGRNYVDLTMLQPGISQNYNMGTAGGVAGSFYSSNGAPILGNNINIDGAFMITTQGGSSSSASGTTLGVDGIKEYKVITTAFSAEYGMTFGSQTTIVSKGGTNQWHGDAFDYLRNSAMDAANYFTTPQATGGRRIAEFRRNNFGASGGGPIQKDKTFFYAVYEGLRQKLGVSAVDTVLPEACYSTGLNGSPANPCAPGSAAIPSITPAIPAGQVSAAVAPILTILGNEVNGLSHGFLQDGPGGFIKAGTPGLLTSSGSLGIWSYPTHSQNTVNFGQIRVDHNFSANDNMFGRWTIDNDDQNVPSVSNAGANAITGSMYPDFYTAESSRNQYATIAENHIFSPTLLNSVHASYTRTDLELDNIVSGAAGGETGNPSVSSNPGYPEGTWTFCSGCSAWGTGGTNGPPRIRPLQNIYTGSEDLFWVHGKHSIKVGVLYNRFNESLQASSNTSGGISFSTIPATTGTPPVAVPGAGQLLSNFYNGVYSSLSGKTPTTELDRDYLFNTVGLYIQDDYRVSQRLTLNLGFRYEFFTLPHELYGRQNSWIVNDVVALGTPGATRVTQQYPQPGPIIEDRSYKNFSPRVGFAYDVFGNGKTAVHGAFGIYGEVGIFGGTVRHDLLADPPYSANLTLTGNSINTILPNCAAGACPNASNGFNYNGFGGQAIPFNPLPAGVALGSPQAYEAGFYGNNIDVADYYAQGAPHVAQWNMTLDQQLPGGFGLSISYVGTRGLQLFVENEGNYAWPCSTAVLAAQAATPVPGFAPGTAVCNGTTPAQVQTNTFTNEPNQLFWNPTYYNQTTENPNNPQAVAASGVNQGLFTSPSTRMNPYWGLATYNSTHGDSWYNGLQVQLTRRLSHGLQLQFAYTYSKVLDTGQGNLSGVDCSSSGGDHGGMPIDQQLDRGPACFDNRNNIHINLLYNLPGIKSTAWYSKLTNGWWVGSITTMVSGYGWTPLVGTNTRSGAGTASDRVDLNTPAELAGAGCLTGSALSAAIAAAAAGANSAAAGFPSTCPGPFVAYSKTGVYTGNPYNWVNPYMFNMGAAGYFGDAGRDGITGPPIRTENFSIVKDTRLPFLGEAGNLEFRAEIFNLFNHPLFFTPNGTIFTNSSASNSVGNPFTVLPTGASATTANGIMGFLNTGVSGPTQVAGTSGDNREVQLALKVIF